MNNLPPLSSCRGLFGALNLFTLPSLFILNAVIVTVSNYLGRAQISHKARWQSPHPPASSCSLWQSSHLCWNNISQFTTIRELKQQRAYFWTGKKQIIVKRVLEFRWVSWGSNLSLSLAQCSPFFSNCIVIFSYWFYNSYW